MKNLKVKGMLALALMATSVVGLIPVTASAATWNNNYGYASMPSQGKWQYQNNSWYFVTSGTQATGWKQIDGKWYLFDTNGIMQTGWKFTGGSWYYLTKDGSMATKWVKDENNNWYYQDDNGARHTGWLLYGGHWYYMDTNTGKMTSGWIDVNGYSYFLQANGAMGTGWIKQSGNWYYLKSDGAKFNPSKDGAILQIGNKYHKFNAGGKWMGECQDSTGSSYDETIKMASPTITGSSFSMTIGQGYNPDRFEAVAKDYTGKDISEKIEYEGTVNTLVQGNYTVRLKITDENGASTEKFCIVYVKQA